MVDGAWASATDRGRAHHGHADRAIEFALSATAAGPGLDVQLHYPMDYIFSQAC
jgi:hypothetical protein